MNDAVNSAEALRSVAEELTAAHAAAVGATGEFDACALACALGLDPHMPVATLGLWRDCFSEVAGAEFAPGMDHPAMKYIDVQVARSLFEECRAAADALDAASTSGGVAVCPPSDASSPWLPECPCERCNDYSVFSESFARRFTMCPVCGNKRCPKGTDHGLKCTGSNEVGQAGSSWQDVR